jgi:hypothetical protein
VTVEFPPEEPAVPIPDPKREELASEKTLAVTVEFAMTIS